MAPPEKPRPLSAAASTLSSSCTCTCTGSSTKFSDSQPLKGHRRRKKETNKQRQNSMKSRSKSQTGGGSAGGPYLIRNAAPAVSTKQTAPPAEGEPITRRFTSSLASLKVGVATNRSNRALQRAGEWGRGDRVRKGRGFATFAGWRAGGPVDGLRQERCCGGAGEEEKNREGEKQVRKPTPSC